MPWLAQPHSDDETRWWHSNVLIPCGTVVVAVREGEVLGFAEPAGGWLHALYVAPLAQGIGVGSALFEHSMAAQHVNLHCSQSNSSDGLALLYVCTRMDVCSNRPQLRNRPGHVRTVRTVRTVRMLPGCGLTPGCYPILRGF